MLKNTKIVSLFCLCLLTLLCAACGGGEAARVTVFALEGPPLAIAGEQGELKFEGEMDRSCMVGSGHFKLVNLENGAICQGEINNGPSNKGRIRGLVSCGDLRFLMLIMSNQGPDQGVGVGRFAYGSDANGENREHAESNPNDENNVNTKHGEDAESGNDSANTAQTIALPELDIEAGDPLLFYYHPWIEEARRRLIDVRENVTINLQRKADSQNNSQPKEEEL
ncbi:MAG: hypothetical protein LBV80_05000 [Deltaproteobacteria bacterium]|jgi:hypothetical protein|nr:hypothetical protein [Deltaproteobacteria bacterium]